MENSGRLVPEVGYWAAPFDPRGALHPLYYTSQVGGHWVNVTTLPMVYIGLPLYDVAGERGLLIVPMIGAVLCVLAARRLGRLLGSGDGWTVFWVVGLATPVAVYALDFWEHTLGLSCMLFGICAFVDIARRPARFRSVFLAGLLFGAAATMRTEALVYLATATAIVLAFRLVRRDRVRRVVALGVAVSTGAMLVLVVNQVLERLVFGSSLRAGRAAGTAGSAGSGLSGRVGEAFVTTFGLNGLRPPVDVFVGIGVVGLVGVGVFLLGFVHPRRPLPGATAFVIAGIVLVARFGDGFGFVPGMLVASPLAAVGLMYGWRERRAWFPFAVASASLPLVWMFQYQGGARPQWGGRYVLLSGVLLAVVGAVVLRRRRAALVATIVLSLFITASGVVWLSERSHAVADGMETLLARDDQAIISTDAHLFREGGAFYTPDRHWLTALTDSDLMRAARVVARAGDHEVAVIGSADRALPRRLGDFARGPSQRVEMLPGTPLRVVTYVRS